MREAPTLSWETPGPTRAPGGIAQSGVSTPSQAWTAWGDVQRTFILCSLTALPPPPMQQELGAPDAVLTHGLRSVEGGRRPVTIPSGATEALFVPPHPQTRTLKPRTPGRL